MRSHSTTGQERKVEAMGIDLPSHKVPEYQATGSLRESDEQLSLEGEIPTEEDHFQDSFQQAPEGESARNDDRETHEPTEAEPKVASRNRYG